MDTECAQPLTYVLLLRTVGHRNCGKGLFTPQEQVSGHRGAAVSDALELLGIAIAIDTESFATTTHVRSCP
jgi:hypothetical protein